LKIFTGPLEKLRKVSDKYVMNIDANPAEIKSQQPYHTSIRKPKPIKDSIDKLQDLGIIQESKSEIASPIVVVQKGKPHFCIDIQEVNAKTKADHYTLPRQDSIFRALAGEIFLSTFNCNKSYHQIPLTLRSRKLTIFITKDDFFEFLRALFDLKNAPAHFQRIINAILEAYL